MFKRLNTFQGGLMYNVKLSRYLNSMEIVIYDKCISGNKKEKTCPISYDSENNPHLVNTDMLGLFAPSKKEKQESSLHSFYVSRNRTKQKIYNYARANKWDWFFTFTFNPKIVDSYNYDELTEIMHSWLRFMSDNNKSNILKYLIVPELHKSGRWHFHGLFTGLDYSAWKLTYSGHNVIHKYVKDGKAHYKKTDEPIFNISGFPYGWTTATSVKDTKRVSHYIVKYITKDMDGALKGKKRYWASRSCSCGIHETFYMNKTEIKTLLETFGDSDYQKTVSTPYNEMKYYEYDYCINDG